MNFKLSVTIFSYFKVLVHFLTQLLILKKFKPIENGKNGNKHPWTLSLE